MNYLTLFVNACTEKILPWHTMPATVELLQRLVVELLAVEQSVRNFSVPLQLML